LTNRIRRALHWQPSRWLGSPGPEGPGIRDSVSARMHPGPSRSSEARWDFSRLMSTSTDGGHRPRRLLRRSQRPVTRGSGGGSSALPFGGGLRACIWANPAPPQHLQAATARGGRAGVRERPLPPRSWLGAQSGLRSCGGSCSGRFECSCV
jgi:hypothetical protein